MEVKKSKKADMTNRSSLYFLIGLNIVLLLTLFFLEFSRKDAEPIQEEVLIPDLPEEDVIITERQFNEPPPPIDAPAPPEIPVEVETVPDDVKIEKINVVDQKTPKIERNFTGGQEREDNPDPPGGLRQEEEDEPEDEVDETLNIRTATVAPVYPGCEKHKGNNRQLYACFNKSFGNDISQSLDDYELESGERPRQVKLKFEIDKNGNLKIVGKNSDAEQRFVDNAAQAFKRVAKRIERLNGKGRGIEPAKNAKNQSAVMEYTIPIKFTPSR